MRVLLLQLDGKLPNIALMRIAHHLRAQGHHVEYRVAKKAADLEHVAAGYDPRELAKRRVHLPMLPGVE